jgi:ribose transport system substrate-binding protein
VLKSEKYFGILAILFVFVLLFSLSGCGQEAAGPVEEDPATPEEPAEETEIIIGFNNGSTTVDFLRQVGESMERAAAEYGVKLIVAESNFDTEQILPNVDNMLLQGAQVIVDFNVNAEVGGSLVDYCGEQGVPVIGIDVLYVAPSGEEGWFFGANNQMAGEVAGKGLAEAINEQWGGEVEYLLLFFNSENGDLVKKRLSGMYDGMLAAGIDLPEDKVEYIDMGGGGSDTTLAANQKMTDWLTANPNLTKIAVGTVNTETGQGVFSAVQAADRDSNVLLATNNNGQQTLAAFEMGENCWLGGTAYYPTRYGDYIIPLALDILAGKNPDKIQTMEHEFLTRKDIDKIIEENQ